MLRIVPDGGPSRTALAAMLALVCGLALPAAQTREETPKNPFQPSPAILQEGMRHFVRTAPIAMAWTGMERAAPT